jgi:hypothetical protein
MFSRTSASWLIVGLLAGYALAGRSVEAQNAIDRKPPFVAIGDNVRLRFERGTLAAADRDSMVHCVVTGLQDLWVRCGPEDKFATDREERWYSFQRVAEITKRER